jgi:tRNA(adenine34) deaminase
MNSKNQDIFFMQKALQVAKISFDKGEVPVGCIIVKDQKIIATGHNLVETKQQATRHAEMVAIEKAQKKIKNWRLRGCILYCTLEPCLMCCGALLLSRLDRLVYGAPDLRHGAHKSFLQVFEKKHPTHSIEIVSGVLIEESKILMQTFFKKKRMLKLQ